VGQYLVPGIARLEQSRQSGVGELGIVEKREPLIRQGLITLLTTNGSVDQICVGSIL
jgi:hypothetical protein